MTDTRLSLTVIVLTYNEEIHIERCLENVRTLAERLIVVDSFSTDRTVEIAGRLGAEVVQRAFKNQAEQFQWALDTIPVGSDWILRLDADEYLEPALIAELRSRLPHMPAGTTGINLKRKVIFRNQWIKWGGYYPSIFLRIWRPGAARIEQRWMDEHTLLLSGAATTLTEDFVDHNLRDITWWTDKHNGYATRQMVDFLNREHHFFAVDEHMSENSNRQARVKRFLRNKVFGRAPLYVRGLMYFFLRYVLRLGFLDGRQGFVFHFLQGCWNWILIDAKIDEAQAYIRQHGVQNFKQHLKTRYNIDVGS